MPAQDAFQLNVSRKDDAYVVFVSGELDLSHCPDLDAALLEAEQSDAARILVDLGELTFVDSSGLGVLVRAAARSSSNGNRLRMTPGQGQVAAVLRLTGLDDQLPLVV